MAKFSDLENIGNHIMEFGVIINFIGLLGGCVLIWRMKQRYLQEVYMLSFLSESMIARNKQI
jgi:hypothetical protein